MLRMVTAIYQVYICSKYTLHPTIKYKHNTSAASSIAVHDSTRSILRARRETPPSPPQRLSTLDLPHLSSLNVVEAVHAGDSVTHGHDLADLVVLRHGLVRVRCRAGDALLEVARELDHLQSTRANGEKQTGVSIRGHNRMCDVVLGFVSKRFTCRVFRARAGGEKKKKRFSCGGPKQDVDRGGQHASKTPTYSEGKQWQRHFSSASLQQCN